jgi:hypothetical protein
LAGVSFTSDILSSNAGNSGPTSSHRSPHQCQRAWQANRLTTIRLRMLIGRELEERDITTPAVIGEALGMPAAEAVKLLAWHRWHEGDVARLEAAAARLGVLEGL